MNKLYEKLNNKAKKSEKGFTLVELLVVILIVGILIAIAVPQFLNQGDGANDTAAKTYVDTAYTALKTAQATGSGTFEFTGNGAETAINNQEGAGFADANATVPASGGDAKVYITAPAATTADTTVTLVGVSADRSCTTEADQSGIGDFSCADR